MKKFFENQTQDETEKKTDNFSLNEQTKTTNVNILLNRVRLDKKKTFRRKLIYSLALVVIINPR